MYNCFRPDDIILAVVVSLGDLRHYELSTAGTELGVVTARCEDGHPLVPASWTTMRCKCRTERRKVAKVMPPKNQTVWMGVSECEDERDLFSMYVCVSEWRWACYLSVFWFLILLSLKSRNMRESASHFYFCFYCCPLCENVWMWIRGGVSWSLLSCNQWAIFCIKARTYGKNKKHTPSHLKIIFITL